MKRASKAEQPTSPVFYGYLARYYMKAAVTLKIMGRVSEMSLDKKAAQWEKLRASVKGHDAWLVIGNGPSLQLGDIEEFHALGVPTIASNKINILFNRTAWRPTFYTISDALLMHKLPVEHYNDFDTVLLPHKYYYMARGKNLLPWRHLLDGPGEKKYAVSGEALSPMNGFFPGRTITCPNLQLAMWAGAKTIYLIGIDHSYANEGSKYATSDRSKKSAHQGESNHFDPNYRKPGEIVNEAPINMMEKAYRLMRTIAEQRGVRIVNVSRRTFLDAYERDTVENALAAIRRRNMQAVPAEVEMAAQHMSAENEFSAH